jgi:hypothetical protein
MKICKLFYFKTMEGREMTLDPEVGGSVIIIIKAWEKPVKGLKGPALPF